MFQSTFDNNQHRLVHLDLKGAPPKVTFYEQFFPFIKSIGATGILLEWEDTFPYTGNIRDIGSLSKIDQKLCVPYTAEDAKHILNLAEDCGLTVIPLIQTFGHMEFVLKHPQWRNLREVPAYPSSICPSHLDTLPLICEIVQQVIEFHQNIKYIHIGADEVWHMGLCPVCSELAQTTKYGKASLYLEHLKKVINFIKTNYPNLNIIIWDDMLRNVDLLILQDYALGSFVEPMIWHYNSSNTFQINELLLEKYSKVFPNIWGATAFKGATSSCQILPDLNFHVSNHEAWIQLSKGQASKFKKFQGIVLTGWSRYDHYASLCELLPCAIPSLCLCMKTWINEGYSPEISRAVAKMLGYKEGLLQESFSLPEGQQLNFPGWEVLIGFQWFVNLRNKYKVAVDSDQVQTWLNKWQISNNYTNPMQIESILPTCENLLLHIKYILHYLKIEMEKVYYSHTIEELIGTLIVPMEEKLKELKSDCERQLSLSR